jgi:hypothetical protein
MVHRIWFLVGQDAALIVLSSTAVQPVDSPTAVLVGLPVEKLDTWGRPSFPNKLPSVALHLLEPWKVAT